MNEEIVAIPIRINLVTKDWRNMTEAKRKEIQRAAVGVLNQSLMIEDVRFESGVEQDPLPGQD